MGLILISTGVIYAFGLLNLFGTQNEFLINELGFFLIACLVFIVSWRLGIHFFQRNALVFYLVSISLLVLTIFLGSAIKGSQRWIQLGWLNFQPSETMKIFFIIYLAHYLSQIRSKKIRLWEFLILLLIFMWPILIIIRQPDLGTAIIYFIIFTLMLAVFVPVRKYLFYLLVIIFLTLPFLWSILKTYQKQRVLSFLNPEIDPLGISYNIIQAMITIGAGGAAGKGLGGGTQSRLAFLPENHTDFAFASLIEQFGLFGGFIILFFYLTIIIDLVILLFKLSKSDKYDNYFHFFVVLGIVSCFTIHVLVNLAMNLGLLPVVGITLPFISYGGSSLILWGASWGIIASIKHFYDK